MQAIKKRDPELGVAKPFNPDDYKSGDARMLAFLTENVGRWFTVDELRKASRCEDATRIVRRLREEGARIAMKPRPRRRHNYLYRLAP